MPCLLILAIPIRIFLITNSLLSDTSNGCLYIDLHDRDFFFNYAGRTYCSLTFVNILLILFVPGAI